MLLVWLSQDVHEHTRHDEFWTNEFGVVVGGDCCGFGPPGGCYLDRELPVATRVIDAPTSLAFHDAAPCARTVARRTRRPCLRRGGAAAFNAAASYTHTALLVAPLVLLPLLCPSSVSVGLPVVLSFACASERNRTPTSRSQAPYEVKYMKQHCGDKHNWSVCPRVSVLERPRLVVGPMAICNTPIPLTVDVDV